MQDADKSKEQLIKELQTFRRQSNEQQRTVRELELFKAIIDGTDEAVAICDLAGNLSYINPAHESLFQCSLEAGRRLHFRDVYPPKLNTILDKEIMPALSRGEHWQGECDVFGPGGCRFSHWEQAYLVASQEGGHCVLWFGDIHHVANCRRIEGELRQLNRIAVLRGEILNILATVKEDDMYSDILQLLRRFFHSEYGFFGYIGEDGSLVCPSMTRDIWNQCQMGQKTMVFPREVWGGLWGQVLREKKSHIKNETHRVPEGHIPLYRSLGVPILHQEELIGSIHLANRAWDYDQKDIEVLENIVSFIAPVLHARLQRNREERERAAIEAQLRQAQKMEAIGTLAGGIAHDFNNILATMLGYTELLLDKLPEESEEKDHLEQVLRAEIRATNLVSQILTFSRAEKHALAPMKIPPLVKEALKMIRAVLPANIEIQQHIDPDCPPIFASATQMHQVLINLCTNASQAMGEQGGLLEVRLELVQCTSHCQPAPELAEGTYLKLTVRDTGCGMTPEIQRRIFDPFFTTKSPGSGTGLGLSVVHGIVRNHKGVIDVESAPGRGTTFCVFFPVVEEAEDISPTEAVEAVARAKGDEHIMIVEDEVALADFYRIYLTTLGYRITVLDNGDGALKVFHEHPERFDLVFTDQAMPGMTGAQLSQRLLAIRPDLPIILATGYSSAVSEKEATALGIKQFLMKPVKMGALTQAIRHLLDGD